MPPKRLNETVTDVTDLTGTDEEILDELQKGARTKGALVDETGRHRNTIGHRLDVLEASEIIEQIHDSTALYELVEDPRKPKEYTALGDDLEWEKLQPVGPYSAERLEYVIDALESADKLADGLTWNTVIAENSDVRLTMEEMLGALGESKWLLEWAKEEGSSDE